MQVVSVALIGVAVSGVLQLETEFKTEWYLPDGSDIKNYVVMDEEYFSNDGLTGAVYVAELADYPAKMADIKKLADSLQQQKVQQHTCACIVALSHALNFRYHSQSKRQM